MPDSIKLLETELAQLTQQLADLPAPVPQPTPPDPSRYTDPAALGEWRDL